MHLIRHGEPKIFHDPYAIQLTSPFWRTVTKCRFLYWLFNLDSLYGWIHPVIGDVVARARYAEEQLESAIREGVSQYVLLGAGMDSFALRRPDLTDGLAILEIDHPTTQQLKKKRLADMGMSLPKGHSFLPVDFEQESLAEALSRSSFSAEVPAFFSWLGTVVYLQKTAVLQTLADVATCACRGSRLVFTYCDAEPLEGGPSSEAFAHLVRATHRRGEPMVTGFRDKELFSELRGLGFELVETLSSDEIQRRYFWGRTDGLTMLEHVHFACVRVVPAEQPAMAV
jgi:methyltransferase (TIGR00027 family)